MRDAIIVTMLSAGLAAGSGLAPVERDAVAAGLDALGIERSELGFFKQWATDSFFRLKAIDFLLDNPLEVAGYVDSSAAVFLQNGSKSPAINLFQLGETDVRLSNTDTARLRRELTVAGGKSPTDVGLPAPVAQAVGLILAGLEVAERHVQDAVRGLSSAELDRLLGEAPGFWTDDDSRTPSLSGVLHREFGREYDTSQEVKPETLLAYLRRLDRAALARAGLALIVAARDAEELLSTSDIPLPHELTGTGYGVDGPVLFQGDTKWGRVTVGGPEDNVYLQDHALVIDLGGDDVYRCRVAGGIGILGPAAAVAIDLDGDDLYDCSSPFSAGAALLGAGVLIDRAGDDVYRTGHYSLGSAILGTGVLIDRGGDDVYDAGAASQGAATVGTGTLADLAGNDSYCCEFYGQGFAGTWGYGLLVDSAGNDRYFAGGKHLHEPLLPREHQSFAQGFAIGWRPDAAGGIGFLCDGGGNDFYDAEVFCQGTSYWYSLGALWDADGYDHYTAAQYSQGAGIHLAVGCLIDNDGNDSYYSRLGPSQGEGHDLSVGVLVDRRGHDVYYASGGQGASLTNSVGLLVDVEGNDCYSGTEDVALGGGRPARGFASVGLFVDLAGRDHYTAGSAGSDFGRWTNGTYGVGLDISRDPVRGDEADEGDTLAVADSIELPVDSIFKIAATWGVGNARARVRQAQRQLTTLGRVAVEYVFREKVDTKDGLELQAIEDLLEEMPDTARPFLFSTLRDERWRARANAVYWLGKLGANARDAVDSLFLALRQDRASARWVARALGDIGDSTVVPRLLYLFRDEYEPSRITVAEACGKLKNPEAVPALVRALRDRLFTVRSAAEEALIRIGRPAVGSLLDSLDRLAPPASGHGCRILGRIAPGLDSAGDRRLLVRCRQALVARLGSDSRFVRLTAVQALGYWLDAPLRLELERVESIESDRFVLAAIRDLLRRPDD